MVTADTVVLSHPEGLSDRGREAIDEVSFRSYLTKAHETATEGDVWEEFVGVGCCGDTLDVDLRVERVDGGPDLGADTDVSFVERSDGSVEGGWRVQSAAGPTTESGGADSA